MTQWMKALVYLAVWAIAAASVFELFHLTLHTEGALLFLIALFTVKLGLALFHGTFQEVWRHVSLPDLAALLQCTLVTIAIMSLAMASNAPLHLPWLAVVDGGISLALLGGLRLAPRVLNEVVRPALARSRRPVILAGSDNRVELELRRMDHRPSGSDRVVGLVLDQPKLVGSRLHRRAIINEAQLEAQLRQHRVKEVILVQPTSAAFTARIEQLCAVHRVRQRSVASLLALPQWSAGADMLDREPAEFDPSCVRPLVANRRVLVTGAAGSIGSELVRQLTALEPARLVLIDRWENGLFHLEQELRARSVVPPFETVLLDVRDEAAMTRLFAAQAIDVVFHAAAHKHVPLVEQNVTESVLNNVIGTRTLVELADAAGVGAFVYISTDKAVQPTSVMGACKRVGELIVKAMAGRSNTRFVAVRFGNVLGSNGSVLPLFIDQIQRGGPVTVTHRDMCRYFMSIREACQLVLRALALGHAGELFVLHMGEPVRIVDLAERLIERAGLRPDVDVRIVFGGPRPGEKLTEQLTGPGERLLTTEHAGLLRVDGPGMPWAQLRSGLDALEEAARHGLEPQTLALLKLLIPDYGAVDAWFEAAPIAQEAR